MPNFIVTVKGSVQIDEVADMAEAIAYLRREDFLWDLLDVTAYDPETRFEERKPVQKRSPRTK